MGCEGLKNAEGKLEDGSGGFPLAASLIGSNFDARFQTSEKAPV